MEEVQTEYGDKRRSVCRTAGRELHTNARCFIRAVTYLPLSTTLWREALQG
jgi:hypothetical protein